jgi:hypothetical protein
LTTTHADQFNADLMSFLPPQAALADRVAATPVAREGPRSPQTVSDQSELSR